MIDINDLAMQQGGKLLFHNVNLDLVAGHRYALVGANGTGKSSFLSLLAKQEHPSEGEIVISKQKTIGWLKQDHFQYENNTLIELVMRGKQALWDALIEKEEILTGTDFTEENGIRLGELEEIIAHCNGYTAEQFASKLLIGLGVAHHEHQKKLNQLSGGYKLRVLLAQTLFQEPDVLLLDEPTNHLDIMSTLWLENYLVNEYKGILVVVSHDRNFLNNISTHVLDIDYGEINVFVGNYDKSLEDKQELVEQKLHAKKHVEDKIADMQRFVDKFKYKPSKAKQAMSREKMISRLEIPDIQQSSRHAPYFRFIASKPSGKNVLKVNSLAKSYGEKHVLTDLNCHVYRKDRIAILGHNGIGKSTFLKIIVGQLEKSAGEFEWGHNVEYSYFSQDHHDLLNKPLSVFEWLTEQVTTETSSNIRKVLGNVLFTKDDVDKNILSVSGGEAARLLLAKIVLQKPNIILLDEPTNHLDLESIDALIEALKNYDGTLIFVSHNRYLVEKLANRLFIFTENGLFDHKGDYVSFVQSYGSDYFSQAWLKAQQAG